LIFLLESKEENYKMAFWGSEVTPNKEVPFVPPPDQSKLHVSQACLAPGSKGTATILVKVGSDDKPLAICTLKHGSRESLSLDLIFDSYTEFTISGNATVHLTGYYMPEFEVQHDDDDDSEDDYDNDFGLDMDMDEDDAAIEALMKDVHGLPDNFILGVDKFSKPITAGMLKERAHMYEDDDSEEEDESFDADSDEDEEEAIKGLSKGVVITDITESDEEKEKKAEGKNSNKVAAPPTKDTAKKRKVQEAPIVTKEPKKKTEPKTTITQTPPAQKSPKVRTFPNGFEIHALKQGRPDAPLAKPGKKVEVKYIGRLKSNDKVFDQTHGNKTFKFRLGVGEVIKGWDRGVDGMRVGDKRELVVPPQMAYGAAGVRGAIPGNAWLKFEVELISVK